MKIRSPFAKAEKAVLQFFQSKEAYEVLGGPHQFKRLFSLHDQHLDFILLEGSLKADLLKSKIFSDQEAAFLQRDPDGKKSFCQFAEFFMNAFKLGHTALGLSVEKYIVPVDSDRSFQPLTNSMVLFPKTYEKLYALDSCIAKCFRNCFLIQGNKVSGITIWNVTYKRREA